MKPLPPALNTQTIPSPIDYPSTRILGARVDLLSKDLIYSELNKFLGSDETYFIVTINALMLLETKRSPLLREAIETAALVVTDSSGMTWAARFLNRPIPERIPGIDLSFNLCELAAKNSAPIFLLGGKPGVAARASSFLNREIPTITIGGTHHGFFSQSEETQIIEDIKKVQPRLVFLALGMPRQEEWFMKNRRRLPPALYIGVGGTFDVWAGDLNRAPLWFQRSGLEWLYRTIQEPFRWKRIAQLPLFVLEVIKEKFFKK